MSSAGWEGLGGPVRMDQANMDGIDPTLDACCRREEESNRRRSALEQTLSRHDVVNMAERRKRHLVSNLSWGVGCRCCYDPNSDGGEYRALIEARQRLADETEVEEQAEVEDNHEEDSDEDSDDEFDYLLDEDLPGTNELEERRRAQLELAVLEKETSLQHGYGAHRQMHPARVLRAAGLGNSARDAAQAVVVLHLVDPDSNASATLDLCLEKLAETYCGTKFLRSGGRSTLLMDTERSQNSLPRLSAEADMPALVAIREGAVIAVCPRLQGLVDPHTDEVIPEEVRTWLDRAGVLLERAPPMEEICNVRPEEEALYDHMAAAAAKENRPRYNCGVSTCEKNFPHEHVGVQTEQQDGLVVPEQDVVGNTEEDS